MNENKKKCNKDILKMYEKVYTYNIKYHDNVIFLTTFFLFFVTRNSLFFIRSNPAKNLNKKVCKCRFCKCKKCKNYFA